MKFRIQPRILSEFLEKSLNNGRYKLTYDEITTGLWPQKSSGQLTAIRHAWPQAEKLLRRLGTCAMLVTDEYFSAYPNRKEPKSPNTIVPCIACHGRKAAGIRLLTAKGVRDDPMALMYFKLHGLNAKGMIAALEDRATVEWKKGKLSKRAAVKVIEKVTAPILPEHDADFGKLMN